MFKQFIANALLFLVINLFPARGDKLVLALSSAYILFREEPNTQMKNTKGLCYFFKEEIGLGAFSQFLLLGKKYSTRDYAFGHNNSQEYTWVFYENYRYDRSNYCATRLETLKRLKLIKK